MGQREQVDVLVERWHRGSWADRTLEDVVRERLGWTAREYRRWVITGAAPDEPIRRPPR